MVQRGGTISEREKYALVCIQGKDEANPSRSGKGGAMAGGNSVVGPTTLLLKQICAEYPSSNMSGAAHLGPSSSAGGTTSTECCTSTTSSGGQQSVVVSNGVIGATVPSSASATTLPTGSAGVMSSAAVSSAISRGSLLPGDSSSAGAAATQSSSNSGTAPSPPTFTSPHAAVSRSLDELRDFLIRHHSLDLLYRHCVFFKDFLNAGLVCVRLFVQVAGWDARVGWLQCAQSHLQQALQLITAENKQQEKAGGGTREMGGGTGAGGSTGTSLGVAHTAGIQPLPELLPNLSASPKPDLHESEDDYDDAGLGSATGASSGVGSASTTLAVVSAPAAGSSSGAGSSAAADLHNASYSLSATSTAVSSGLGTATVTTTQGPPDKSAHKHQDILTGLEVPEWDIRKLLTLLKLQIRVTEALQAHLHLHLFEEQFVNRDRCDAEDCSRNSTWHADTQTVNRRCEVVERLLVEGNFQLAKELLVGGFSVGSF